MNAITNHPYTMGALTCVTLLATMDLWLPASRSLMARLRRRRQDRRMAMARRRFRQWEEQAPDYDPTR